MLEYRDAVLKAIRKVREDDSKIGRIEVYDTGKGYDVSFAEIYYAPEKNVVTYFKTPYTNMLYINDWFNQDNEGWSYDDYVINEMLNDAQETAKQVEEDNKWR